MVRKFKFLALALVLLLVLAPAAFAKLVVVGPINPANGFPVFYQDANGVAMELTAPPLGTPITVPPNPTPISPTMVFDAPIAGNAFSQSIGFGAECFYWAPDAVFTGSTVGAIVYRAGLEASFGGGVALNGDQMVFSRIRARIKGLVAGQEGTYVVKHPFGTDAVVVTAADIAAGKGLNMTRDIGLAPLNFAAALAGDVGPFLKQTAPILVANAPPGYPTLNWFGDGTTTSPIVGSPTGFNACSITPPAGVDIGAGVGATLLTTQFITSGHQFTGALPTPLAVDRVTYSRDALNTSTIFEAWATSAVTAAVNITIVPPTANPMFAGLGLMSNTFYRKFNFTPAIAIPATVSLTATQGVKTPTTILKQPVDVVTITSAVWTAATRALTVTATSSDLFGAPPLTVDVPPLGPLVAGTRTFGGLNIPPSTVTVVSAAGGTATAPVKTQ